MAAKITITLNPPGYHKLLADLKELQERRAEQVQLSENLRERTETKQAIIQTEQLLTEL